MARCGKGLAPDAAVPEDDHGSSRMGPTPDEAAKERTGIRPLRGTG
jgi:hypothetical protein